MSRLDERLAVSLRQIEAADFILAAGVDPLGEAPMLALALRQAGQKGAPIALLDPRPVSLPCEFQHLAVAPGELDTALGTLVKGALSADQVAGLPESRPPILRRPGQPISRRPGPGIAPSGPDRSLAKE